MKKSLLLLLLLLFALTGTAFAENALPRPNTVTMIDLGAKSCIPCKMMAPVLENVGKYYDGKAAIVFIDVWENPDVTSKYMIQTIPTQIFYDRKGNERERHTGFLDEARIKAKIDALLAE